MKRVEIIILLLISIGISAQNITEINSNLKLSDSLTHNIEIRIYQSAGTTNYSSLFIMHNDSTENWTAEFYEYFAKIEGKTELKIGKRTLKPKNDFDFVFYNLIRSYILELPSLREIEWKLGTRGNVEKIKTIYRGKEIEEYELITKKISIIDGEGFKVQVKDLNKANVFEYTNPDSYLAEYPEIDELIYMCEILKIIRTEFGIWKK